MELADLRKLIDYHYWARDRLLDAVEKLTDEQFTRNMGSSFGSIRDTMAHFYSSEWLWHSRWHGISPTATLAPDLFPDVGSLRAAWTTHESRVRTFFEHLPPDDVVQEIQYKRTDGTPETCLLWQMVHHMVNHASYHRGQVTTMLRQLGAAPPRSMDMITFFRERDALIR